MGSRRRVAGRRPIKPDAPTTTIIYTTTTTTTPTTPAPDVEDLKRPITSPVTAALLLALEAGPATTEELAREVERIVGRAVKTQEVRPYLYYYQRKGWVTRGSPYWSLTDEGRKFVNKYKRWLQRLIGEFSQVGETLLWQSKPEETVYFAKVKMSKDELNLLFEKIKQYLRNPDEEAVMRLLLENYVETGSTYIWLDELAEALGTTPSQLYQEVLRSMRARRLVYVWRDGKVGLGRLARRVLGVE